MRVLYISCSQSDVDSVQRALVQEAAGIKLATVTNVQDALALLPAGPERTADFDVLLVDYCLPGMDGLEFIRLLRKERKLDIPVVLMTGQDTDAATALAQCPEVEGYLIKHKNYLSGILATLEKAQWLAELTRERVNTKRANLRLSHLLAASPVILYNLHFTEDLPRLVWVSENVEQVLGV